jgi:hypothetical protein
LAGLGSGAATSIFISFFLLFSGTYLGERHGDFRLDIFAIGDGCEGDGTVGLS